jgi:NAD(P)H-dependent FMN reductase
MKVQVINASVREGRVTERVAKWVAAEAKKQDGFEVEIVDLKEYELPLFDEPASPQYNPDRKPEGALKKWLDKLAEADAFIIVSPEYNRSIPGPMKNAMDYVAFEFEKKPVLLVTHGSVGGAFALANYRVALAQMQTITIPKPVMISGAAGIISEDGVLEDDAAANPYGPLGALNGGLADLKWYGEALVAARKA